MYCMKNGFSFCGLTKITFANVMKLHLVSVREHGLSTTIKYPILAGIYPISHFDNNNGCDTNILCIPSKIIQINPYLWNNQMRRLARRILK